MSRDWRPCEQVYWDEVIRKQEGKSLMEIASNSIFHYENGEKVDLVDKEVYALFPYLSFLLDGFDELCKRNPEKKERFAEIEKAVMEVRKTFLEERKELPAIDYLSRDADNALSLREAVEQWFFGHFDEGFYHNDRNNGKFRCFIRNYIEEK